MVKKGTIKKARGPMPVQNEEGGLEFSSEDFEGPDAYRAIAGRAKERADYYCDFVWGHCDICDPDLSSNGLLEVFVTWAAFACEVYLKCIIYHIEAERLFDTSPDGSKRIMEHNLLILFKRLAKAERGQKTDYSSQIKKGVSSFEKLLKDVSTYFEKYRYDYELNNEALNYAFVFNLMKRLRSVTDDIMFIKSMEIYQNEDGSNSIS